MFSIKIYDIFLKKLHIIKKFVTLKSVGGKMKQDNYLKYFSIETKKMFLEFSQKETRKKQIPNLLTFSRLLAPIIILPIAFFGNLTIAGIVACLFALTDFFDGRLARKYNVVSEFGKELDPICDKIFACSLAIPLLYEFPIQFLILIILDATIGIVNIISYQKGNMPRTVFLGKLKTTGLSLALVTGYLTSITSQFVPFLNVVVALTSVLEVFAIIEYIKIDQQKSQKIKEAL